MQLATAIDHYATARDLRPTTLAGYRLAIRSLSAFLGRPATAADLTADNLNRWSRALRESGALSPYSVATYRRGILVLTRHLARRGLAAKPDAVELAPIRCPPTPRVVWTADEVDRLLAAVERLDDVAVRDTGVRFRAWWRAAIMAAWDSALRWSDLGRLTHEQIPPAGVLRLVQSKTGVEHVVRFRPRTLAAIREIRTTPTARVWPTPYPTWRHKQLRRILRVAGLTGSLQQLRRSAITAAELDRPGSGHVLAGHTTPATTFRWYIPRTALLSNPPAPPELEALTMDRSTDRPTREHEARTERAIVHRIRIGERFELHAGDLVAEVDVRRDAKRNATELVLRSALPLRIVRR